MSVFGRPKDQPLVLTKSDDGEYFFGYLDDLRDRSGHPLEARVRPKQGGKLWQAEAFDSEGMSVLATPSVRVSQRDAIAELVRRVRTEYKASSGRPTGRKLSLVRLLGLLSGLGFLLEIALILARVLGIEVP